MLSFKKTFTIQLLVSLGLFFFLVFSSQIVWSQSTSKFIVEFSSNPFASQNKSQLKKSIYSDNINPVIRTYSNERASEGLSLSLSLDYYKKNNGIGFILGYSQFRHLVDIEINYTVDLNPPTEFTDEYLNFQREYSAWYAGLSYTRVFPFDRFELLGNTSLNYYLFDGSDFFGALGDQVLTHGIELGIRKKATSRLNLSVFLTTNNFVFNIKESFLFETGDYFFDGSYNPFQYGCRVALGYTLGPKS